MCSITVILSAMVIGAIGGVVGFLKISSTFTKIIDQKAEEKQQKKDI